MTWLFLTNSSEGSQVTIRDLRMPPSLGDTTGRVTSLAPPKEPEGGVCGGEHMQVEACCRRGCSGWLGGTENTGMGGPHRLP